MYLIALFLTIAFMAILTMMAVQLSWWRRGYHVITRGQLVARMVYTGVILEEADRCRQSGEVGALLRHEGLYSSHLTRWRVQLRAGQLEPRKRGRKANPHATEVARLQRANARLPVQLERAELVIDAQKKLCQLFNLPSEAEEIE